MEGTRPGQIRGSISTPTRRFPWRRRPSSPGSCCSSRIRAACNFAGGRVSDYPLYSRDVGAGAAALAFFMADASIDNWTVLRFAGSRCAAERRTAFTTRSSASRSTFYLFDLPFWSDLRGFIFAVVILAILVYWLTARGWQLRFTLPEITRGPIDLSLLRLERRARIEVSARRAGVFSGRAGGPVLPGAASRWCGTSTASWSASITPTIISRCRSTGS